MYTKLYAISGISCENCVSRIQTTLEALPEVVGVQVLPESAQAVVRARDEISLEVLDAALKKAGNYEAQETNKVATPPKRQTSGRSFLRFFHRKKACCQ